MSTVYPMLLVNNNSPHPQQQQKPPTPSRRPSTSMKGGMRTPMNYDVAEESTPLKTIIPMSNPQTLGHARHRLSTPVRKRKSSESIHHPRTPTAAAMLAARHEALPFPPSLAKTPSLVGARHPALRKTPSLKELASRSPLPSPVFGKSGLPQLQQEHLDPPSLRRSTSELALRGRSGSLNTNAKPNAKPNANISSPLTKTVSKETILSLQSVSVATTLVNNSSASSNRQSFSSHRQSLSSSHITLYDPVPALLANRPISTLTILLGNRGVFAKPLQTQLEEQWPPEGYPSLHLFGAANNMFANIGEYWGVRSTKVLIQGNSPLETSALRLRSACAKAEKVKQHVEKNKNISMSLINVMVSCWEDLTFATSDLAADFDGTGGLAAILATAPSWRYTGSDGAYLTIEDFNPIWDMQYALAEYVAQLRMDLVEPITDTATPFATALSARIKVRDGDMYAAMVSLLTYETLRGGPKVAHAIVAREWGLGLHFLKPGQLVDSSWLTAHADRRGGSTPSVVASHPPLDTAGQATHIFMSHGCSYMIPVPLSSSVEFPAGLKAPFATDEITKNATPPSDISLLPNLAANLQSTPFSRCAPHLTLNRMKFRGVDSPDLLGLQLSRGSYHTLKSIHPSITTLSMADALVKVMASVGSKATLAACGYPHMPDGVSGTSMRDMASLASSKMSKMSLAAYVMSRGKSEAVQAILACVSLASRLGGGWEQREMCMRDCEGGFLLYTSDQLQSIGSGQGVSWLCLPGTSIRLVLVCTVDQGLTKCLGTAVFIGALKRLPDGVGAFVN